ncbi:MucR family transcriptional regulator [Sphingobium sp.]|uniref:MucR family transcriptional regulator n=1 Tax=Sphingobium sp. TaxID=1912891 RepID=UPI002B79A16A|nr:MucR family transcriptional regulator [Sphingobium sp.]HUD90524.1 MucR family transcriptional regulator [Sphingobium sp.]
MSDTEQPDFTAMTVQLLSAYFANNQVPAGDIAGIIEATRSALERKAEEEVPVTPEHVPAVSVRKSLGSREHIISMIDGKAYKTLKRHLAAHGLTPAEYRVRYTLPKTYPMVAPAYSEQRRAVAQKLGLGRQLGAKGRTGEIAAVDSAATPAPVTDEKPKRGRLKVAAAKPDVQPDIVPVEAKPEPALPEAASAKPARTKSMTRKAPRASTKTSAASQEVTPAPTTADAVKPTGKAKAAGKTTKPKAPASTEPKPPQRRTLKLKHKGAGTTTKASAE